MEGELYRRPTTGLATFDLAQKAYSLQEDWSYSRTSRLTDEEAVELAYLGYPRRSREKMFPDYRLAAMLAVEHLQYWRDVKNKDVA